MHMVSNEFCPRCQEIVTPRTTTTMKADIKQIAFYCPLCQTFLRSVMEKKHDQFKRT